MIAPKLTLVKQKSFEFSPRDEKKAKPLFNNPWPIPVIGGARPLILA
jgi:hypothetical protein